MKPRSWFMLFSAGLAAIACQAAHAQSFGCYGMPSRVTQYLGYGYGAGHHAPMVRTWAQHPTRVARSVYVPAAYGPLYPAPYAPVGCYGDACQQRAPQPALAPTPAPPEPPAPPAPTPAPEAVEANNRQTWRYLSF